MPKSNRSHAAAGTTVQKLVQAWLSIDDGTTEATREFRYKATRALITMWARRHVSGLTVADAKAIAGKIRAEYASKTAARRLSTIKQWGQWLVDTEILEVNPFGGIRAGSGKVNSTSKRFVSLEEFYGVLKTVKDPEWRVLLVLARFCGLRIPSEVYDLTWSDVLFDDNPPRLRIDKHKTEDRFCPMAADVVRELRALRAILDRDQFETSLVFGRWSLRPDTNLRTQLNRIIVRAGYKPWPRVMHNQRATRCTELVNDCNLSYKETSKYMGNSPAVIMEDYELMRPNHLEKMLQLKQ